MGGAVEKHPIGLGVHEIMNLETAVGSQKSAQDLGTPGTIKN